MEITTASLITGSLGAGLVWWLSKSLSTRLAGKTTAEEVERTSLEDTEVVYRKILHARIASLTACLVAAMVLFFELGTAFALLLAGIGCWLQFVAFRMRTQHMQAVRKAAGHSQLSPSGGTRF